MREGPPDENRRKFITGDLRTPDPGERWFPPDPDEVRRRQEHTLNKRAFLAGGGAASLLALALAPHREVLRALVSSEVPDEDPNLIAALIDSQAVERQKALDGAIAAVQRNLREPVVLKALDGKGEYPLSVIFEAIDIPILPDHLVGTTYDATKLHDRYPIAYTKGGMYCANCVLWNNTKTLLTAAHAEYGDDLARHPVPGIDVAMLDDKTNLAGNNPEKHVIHSSSMPQDSDIHGKLVSIVGVDPDDTAHDSYGRKTYPGIAIKMSAGFVEYVGYRGLKGKQREGSFFVVLPPGEAKEVDDGRNIQASGMSGSPVFAYGEGKKDFAGVFWGAGLWKDELRRRSLHIGLFHGPQAIRELEHTRIAQQAA